MAKSESSETARKGVLLLEDGSIFNGNAFGSSTEISGEVVFSTGMVGYTESLTDPSYRNQILTLTYPLVGNYGVPEYQSGVSSPSFESDGIKAAGLIVHSLCQKPSHWASRRTLHDWLASENIPGIFGIDTRALTKKLREKGVMLGIIKTCEADEAPDLDRLRSQLCRLSDPNDQDLVKTVTVPESITYPSKNHGPRAVILDCGVKYGIIRNLLSRGWEVVRVPAQFSGSEIMELNPSAVVVSNGPGDPAKVSVAIESTRQIIEEKISVIGICLGAQIIALALGASTYKLKYGHRSQNQPVLDLRSGRCYISSQNHGFAVDGASLNQTRLQAIFLNANDQTVEGVKHSEYPCIGVQFHPEASPGPMDTQFLLMNY